MLHKYGIATHFLSVSFPRVFPGYVNEDGGLKIMLMVLESESENGKGLVGVATEWD